MDGCRAYFNVQLITICAVAKSKCSVLNVQLLYSQCADCHVLCSRRPKSCLKYVLDGWMVG